MRLIVWTAVGLAALAVAWFWFSEREPGMTNYPSAGEDIVAIGDSLVSGYGATEGHDFVSVLSQAIDKPIVNLGKAGDKSADVLSRMRSLDAYRPKVVILLVGGNDFLRKVEDDKVFANIAKIIEDIQSRGAIVLLVGIRGGVLSDKYASRFEELARTYRTAYVEDALMGLFGDKRYMSDAIHPNDAGYERLSKRIAPVLVDLLQ